MYVVNKWHEESLDGRVVCREYDNKYVHMDLSDELLIEINKESCNGKEISDEKRNKYLDDLLSKYISNEISLNEFLKDIKKIMKKEEDGRYVIDFYKIKPSIEIDQSLYSLLIQIGNSEAFIESAVLASILNAILIFIIGSITKYSRYTISSHLIPLFIFSTLFSFAGFFYYFKKRNENELEERLKMSNRSEYIRNKIFWSLYSSGIQPPLTLTIIKSGKNIDLIFKYELNKEYRNLDRIENS